MTKIAKFAMLALAGTLVACAGQPKIKDAVPAEEMVARRSAERWAYLIERKPELAWDYLTPGYRSTNDVEQYAAQMKNRPVQWQSAEVGEVACDEEKSSCFVKVQVGFKIRASLRMVGEVAAQSEVGERWLKSGDAWYFLPEE